MLSVKQQREGMRFAFWEDDSGQVGGHCRGPRVSQGWDRQDVVGVRELRPWAGSGMDGAEGIIW